MIKLMVAVIFPTFLFLIWLFVYQKMHEAGKVAVEVGSDCDGKVVRAGRGHVVSEDAFIRYWQQIEALDEGARAGMLRGQKQALDRICSLADRAEANSRGIGLRLAEIHIIQAKLYEKNEEEIRALFLSSSRSSMAAKLVATAITLVIIFFFGLSMTRGIHDKVLKGNWIAFHQAVWSIASILMAGVVFYKEAWLLDALGYSHKSVIIGVSGAFITGSIGLFSKSIRDLLVEVL